MKLTIKKTFLRIIFLCNIGCILSLLISNTAPYLDPYKWWPIALSGLLFPLLLLVTLLFFIFWLPVRPQKAGFSLAALLICLPNIISTFGFTLFPTFEQRKKIGDLRVLTWNTGLMNYNARDNETAIRNNAIIFRKLKEADADIVCLQEFFTAVTPGNPYNQIEVIAKMMNYPYSYFSYDVPKFEGNAYFGTVIFSRYEMVDTQKIRYAKPFYGSILKAGVVVSGDTIDIITSRLQSVHFERNEYSQLKEIINVSDSGFAGTKNIIQKLRLAYKQRTGQVKLLKGVMKDSNRPIIFTGDLNDVPVSYTYREIRNKLKDAWVKKGCGLGRTFIYISPTLRIDHIFYDDHFKVRQVKRIFPSGTTDHNALLADLAFKLD